MRGEAGLGLGAQKLLVGFQLVYGLPDMLCRVAILGGRAIMQILGQGRNLQAQRRRLAAPRKVIGQRFRLFAGPAQNGPEGIGIVVAGAELPLVLRVLPLLRFDLPAQRIMVTRIVLRRRSLVSTSSHSVSSAISSAARTVALATESDPGWPPSWQFDHEAPPMRVRHGPADPACQPHIWKRPSSLVDASVVHSIAAHRWIDLPDQVSPPYPQCRL